jgi:HPt (histidine-containing phosphotransfer) domain-containing protein
MNAHFSVQQLMAMSDNDEEFVRKMVQIYRTYGPECLASLKEALLNEDTPNFRKIAHQLKSSSQLLLLTPIYECMKEFEQVEILPHNKTLLSSQLQKLETQIQQVVRDIENSPWHP